MKQQRAVLVTGGMGGLGETISTKMVAAGYKLAVTYSPSNKTHTEWVANMKANGCDILAVPCDVADFDSCRQAVAAVQSKLGAVEVLVNGSKGAFGQTNDSAAKAGVHGFTKALALEVAKRNVTVNTISPGYIGTKMVTAIPKEVLDSKILPHIPVGRLGKPEEVAGLIIYLASEEAAFVTGANIAINGGQHMQ